MECQVLLRPEASSSVNTTWKKSGLDKGVKANRPRDVDPLVHDPGGQIPSKQGYRHVHHGQAGEDEADVEEASGFLPTPGHLAQSFLEHERPEERAELKAALAKSQHVEEPAINEKEDEDDQYTGLGGAYSLPGFVADFLKGVGDRLQITVKNVQVDVDLRVDTTAAALGRSVSGEMLTLRLSIASISVGEMAARGTTSREMDQQGGSDNNKVSNDSSHIRRIVIGNINVALISEPSLFNFLAQFSGPPSPAATHTNSFPKETVSPAPSDEPGHVSSPSISSRSLKHLRRSESSTQSLHTASAQDSFTLATSTDNFADVESGDELQPSRGTTHSFTRRPRTAAASRYKDFDEDDDAVDSLFRGPAPKNNDDDDDDGNEPAWLYGVEDSETLPEHHTSYQRARSAKRTTDESLGTSMNSSVSNLTKSSHENITTKAAASGRSASGRLPFAKSARTGILSVAESGAVLGDERGLFASSSEHIQHPEQSMLTSNETSRGRDGSGSQDALLFQSMEDLAESKIFSHDEVTSMYLSAMSHDTTSRTRQDLVPGDWETSEEEEDEPQGHMTRSIRSSARALSRDQAENPGTKYEEISQDSSQPSAQELPETAFAKSRTGEPFVSEQSDISTSKAVSPDKSKSEHIAKNPPETTPLASSRPLTSTDQLPMMKVLLQLRSLIVEISGHIESPPVAQLSGHSTSSTLDGLRQHEPIPGAFSEEEEPSMLKSRHLMIGTSQSIPIQANSNPEKQFPIKVLVDEIVSTGDMGIIRLLIMITQQLGPTLSVTTTSEKTQSRKSSLAPVDLVIHTFQGHFVDVVKGTTAYTPSGKLATMDQSMSPREHAVLLSTCIEDFSMSITSRDANLEVDLEAGKFFFGYENDPIISFDSSLRMRESVRDVLAPKDSDIAMTILKNTTGFSVQVTTLPLHLVLNLAHLDETFTWFGGLSTVLGLGSSVMSTVTVIEPKLKKSTPAIHRGVRFETSETHGTAEAGSHVRATVRIGGLFLEVQGKHCHLLLQGSAVKLVNRAEGIGIKLDRLQFSGPHVELHQGPPAISIQVVNTRFEYLAAPKEMDLARLLALLCPSKFRDAEDDDVLIDTLLRQRKKGGVLRVNIEKIQGSISRLHDLKHFDVLAEELKKLASVTKYLPEDDRPGVLTLILVQQMSLSLDVNKMLHSLNFQVDDFEVAHVTLPILLLTGIRSMTVQHEENELLGDVLPRSMNLENPSPMISVKFIGDEMEPTIKIKLWNMRAEYHVSFVMSVLGLEETATGDVIAAEIVNSVATLTGRPVKLDNQSSLESDRSFSGVGVLNFDVSIRDSVIGLNPRRSPAKGLVFLKQTKCVGDLPRNEQSAMHCSLEIKKASLLEIDDTKNLECVEEIPQGGSHLQLLVALGFVSISDISSAKVVVQVVTSADGQRTMDVDVRDDLFVLETCADSTQTLLTILNGLNPPAPPSTELKYRTEIVPVEDMLASFTGDAFIKDDDESLSGDDFTLEDGDMVDEDVPQNLEFVNSFYDSQSIQGDESTVASLTEDGFHVQEHPPSVHETGGKRLLQSFQERFEIAPGGEELDFDDNHFGSRSMVGGTAHRWNSDLNTYDLGNELRIKNSPIRIQIRDVHFIWNLFDGYDWQRTRDVINQAVVEVEAKAAEKLAKRGKRRSIDFEDSDEDVIGDFLFNSIYIEVNAHQDPRDLTASDQSEH